MARSRNWARLGEGKANAKGELELELGEMGRAGAGAGAGASAGEGAGAGGAGAGAGAVRVHECTDHDVDEHVAALWTERDVDDLDARYPDRERRGELLAKARGESLER